MSSSIQKQNLVQASRVLMSQLSLQEPPYITQGVHAFPNSSQASDLSKKEDLEWCAGTDQLWALEGANPCKVLVSGFEQLSGPKLNWFEHIRRQFESNLKTISMGLRADSFLVRLAIRVAPRW